MAHYAILGDVVTLSDNVSGPKVEQVIVVDNDYETPSDDPMVQEIGGLDWLSTFPPMVGKTCVKTSYNRAFRKNYAAREGIWDAGRNAFIPPKGNSQSNFSLDEETCQWVPA